MKRILPGLILLLIMWGQSIESQAQARRASKEQLDSIIILQYVNGSAGYFQKTEFTYTHNEKVKTETIYLRTADKSGWKPVTRKSFSYDANNLLDELLWQNWDENSNVWSDNLRMDYTNNANGKPVQTDFYFWNTNTSNWMKVNQENYTYNANMDLEKHEKNLWVNGNQVPEEKTEYFYHADNRFDYKVKSTYNGSGWDNDTREEVTYTGNKELIGVLYFEWIGGKFLQIGHANYVPDFNGNNSERTFYSYLDGNTTDYVTRTKFTYDLSVDITEVVGLNNDPYKPFTNKLVSSAFERQEDGIGNFEPQYDYVYHYSSYTPSAVQEMAYVEMTCFPNPSSTNIQLSVEGNQNLSYRIIDMTGREMLQGSLEESSQIDISALNQGVYVILAEGNNRLYRAKFTKN